MSRKICKNVSEVKVINVHRSGQHILSDEERKKYTVRYPFPQEFSLPSNIIYYVARNPKFPRGHRKFVSTSKALFGISRIFPVSLFHHYEECIEPDEEADDGDCNKWLTANKESKKIFFKLWICNYVDIFSPSPSYAASNLIKKCHKFSLRSLKLCDQVLTLKELQIIVSGDKLQSVELVVNVIKNADGSIAEFGKVFELLCCKNLKISFPDKQHGIGKNTAKKIGELLSSEQVPAELKINFDEIPEEFDFLSFSNFLKKNMTHRQHSFDLQFSGLLSDAYINQLQNFVYQVIPLRGIFAHTIPLMDFPREDFNSCHELYKMRHGKVEGVLSKPRN